MLAHSRKPGTQRPGLSLRPTGVRRRPPVAFSTLRALDRALEGRVAAVEVSTEERAERLHAAVLTTFEGWFSAVPEASFERREGHERLLFPSVPFRLFNGVVVESQRRLSRSWVRQVETHFMLARPKAQDR